MTRRTTTSKTNGHAGPKGRTNGHARASTEGGGVRVQRDRAASDDASGASAARAAGSATAPGTDHEAYAEAAPPRPNGNLHDAAGKPPDLGTGVEEIPGGGFPLSSHPRGFCE